jgi:hypothetical protein
MKLFVYNPSHPDSRPDGIIEYGILCATIRLTGEDKNLVRFIIGTDGQAWHIDNTHKQLIYWAGHLSKIEKAFAASEGSEFKGWGNTKQYRLTREEIKSFVVEKEGKLDGRVETLYRVFTPCGVAGVPPSWVTGNKEDRGYLTRF